MFKIAHISDLHMAPLPAITRGEWHLKRLIGNVSWQRNRQYRHHKHILDTLRQDLIDGEYDHICCTGDMTNLGLEKEYINAKEWLENIGKADTISLVPGNHDAYGTRDYKRFIKSYWADYIQCDIQGKPAFPFVHRRENIAFFGVSSAVPTLPFFANGRIDHNQIKMLDTLLEKTKDDNLVRIVMLHHPPISGLSLPQKALFNPKPLQAVVSKHQVDLILHGHTHHEQTNFIDTVPVIDAGSASYGDSLEKPSKTLYKSHYNVIYITNDNTITARHRYYNARANQFEDANAISLTQNH